MPGDFINTIFISALLLGVMLCSAHKTACDKHHRCPQHADQKAGQDEGAKHARTKCRESTAVKSFKIHSITSVYYEDMHGRPLALIG